METAEQNTKQVMEENEALKQLIELLNQQDMDRQSQDFMGIFWYVAGMQMQLTAMVDELQGVREQLSQMQENQPKSVTEHLQGFPLYQSAMRAWKVTGKAILLI